MSVLAEDDSNVEFIRHTLEEKGPANLIFEPADIISFLKYIDDVKSKISGKQKKEQYENLTQCLNREIEE